MDHVKIIQAIKNAQYETFKRIMRESKSRYRVPARVGLTRIKEKEFKARMNELEQDYYFWTTADTEISDAKLVECRDQNTFSVFIHFPVFNQPYKSYNMIEHARCMVNTLKANGLTAVWQGSLGMSIEVIIGVDTVAANVMKVQCATFDELFA